MYGILVVETNKYQVISTASMKAKKNQAFQEPLHFLCNVFLNGTVPDTGCSINLCEWDSGHKQKSGKCLTRINIARGVLQVFS
jgi:hypothetical protein